jgi:hypothetical protein
MLVSLIYDPVTRRTAQVALTAGKYLAQFDGRELPFSTIERAIERAEGAVAPVGLPSRRVG